MGMTEKLTKKQELFCEEYLKDHKVIQAYIRAGYSKATADNHAWTTFNKPQVQAHIKKLQAERRERNEVTINTIVSSFQRIAQECEDQGNYKDALRALENLGKYLGMYTEQRKTEVTITSKDEQYIDNEIKRLIALQSGEEDAEALYDMEVQGRA